MSSLSYNQLFILCWPGHQKLHWQKADVVGERVNVFGGHNINFSRLLGPLGEPFRRPGGRGFDPELRTAIAGAPRMKHSASFRQRMARHKTGGVSSEMDHSRGSTILLRVWDQGGYPHFIQGNLPLGMGVSLWEALFHRSGFRFPTVLDLFLRCPGALPGYFSCGNCAAWWGAKSTKRFEPRSSLKRSNKGWCIAVIP